MLLHDYNSKKDNAFLTTADKYRFLKGLYIRGHTYVILNNISVFAPFDKPKNPYTISEDQFLCIYNKEVVKLLNWIKVNIILELGSETPTTINVLLRIATGMINKLNIDDKYKQQFHTNMTHNIQEELRRIVYDELPF